MADALSLLFQLDVDGRPAAAALQRFRKDIAATIAAAQRAVTQPLQSPNTASFTKAAVATQELTNRSTRAAQAAQKLQTNQQILATSTNKVAAAQQQAANAAQRAANGHTQAAAGAIRAATSYQRATVAANNFAQSNQNLRRALSSVQSSLRSVGSALQSAGRTLTIGLTVPLLALGAASLKSAKDIDANVNTLKAFIGSADDAERRLAQLIKTARGTPGLTTNLALTLDAQLRTAKVVQETIDRVLPAIGRLNAVSKLPDPTRFVDNLKQLITQNFEKQDLKELVGQSPLAGQLITEIFNVDSPTNAKVIKERAKKLGLTTIDAFFAAFADAAEKNQGLQKVTESIGTRFDKIADRVTIALRPLGLAILKTIEPFIEPLARLVERIGAAFNSLSDPVKTAILVIAGIAAATGPVLLILGSLASTITAVVSAIGAVSAAVAAIGFPAIGAGVALIVAGITGWVAVLTTLGLAWKANFLDIRELVTDAASAVAQAFGRVKEIVTETVERVLPTLQSITTKVLTVVSAAWAKYGKDVIAVIGVAFNFATRVVESFLRTFGNIIDLLLKLIDGDFRGAWNAFSRIIVNALTDWNDFLQALGTAAVKSFTRLIAFIAAQAVTIAKAGHDLALRFVSALALEIISGFPTVRDAITEMFAKAALGFDPTVSVAILIAKFIDAIKKGAKVRVPLTIEPVLQENLERIELNPDGSLKRKKPTATTAGDENTKGADAATRRRIRLLELEAEKTESINRQNIDAERLRFELRDKSLRQATEDEIKLEQEILEKKKKVFAAELIEAQKLGKGRELAIKEINLKSLQAEIEFHNKENQLRVNQEKEEQRAAIEHRQKLLDIQEEGDHRQIARLEELSRTGGITAFELESRRVEIEAAGRRRRRSELETELKEAKENKEERERIIDELAQFDEASATATEEGERRKRDALQETVRAYNDYRRAITDAIAQTDAAIRDLVRRALERPEAAFILGRARLIKAQFRLRQQDLEADRKAAKQQIDDEEHDAIERAKLTGDFERRRFEIEKTFRERRRAADLQFRAERRALTEEEQRELERADPGSGRSVLGDVFADVSKATGSTLQGLLATGQDVFSQLSAQSGNMRDILVSAFSAIGQAVGDAAQAFVLYGNAGTSIKKFAAQVIAGVAAMAATKAIFELAEGFAALARGIFGNPKAFAEAAMHFKSAAIYGAVAGVAALSGRAVAGNSFSDSKGTAAAAVNGGEPNPQNREFQNGSQVVESSSSARRDGSGGSIFQRLSDRIEAFQQQNLEIQKQQQLHNAQVAQALGRLNTAKPGDVVTAGASDARQAIGVAVIDHGRADAEFVEQMQRNLGFAQ